MAKEPSVERLLSAVEAMISRRKLRLLTCTFTRQVWELLSLKGQGILEWVENYAEFTAAQRHDYRDDLQQRHVRAAEMLLKDVAHSSTSSKTRAAMCLASCTLQAHYFAARYTSEYAALTHGKRSGVLAAQSQMIHDVYPFSLVKGKIVRSHDLHLDERWLRPHVLDMAEVAYTRRRLPLGHLENDRLAVLADALEEEGCLDAALLSHLRSSETHIRGCWALDLILKNKCDEDSE